MFDDDEREQMPLEAREIHQRLLDDSSRWARELPANARVAEFARTLPRRMPSPSAIHTRNVLAHRRPSSTLPDMMSVKGHTNMLKSRGPLRTILASIAAVAVVALMVGVIYGKTMPHGAFAGSGGNGPGIGHGSVKPTPSGPAPTPGKVYGATPGPQAKYIAEIATASGRTTDGTPTHITTHFVPGDWVYVIAVVRGLPKGTHVVSIAWYRNGVFLELPVGPTMNQTIDGDKRVTFGLEYPATGEGAAKIFIDRPASDTSESPNDPYLAYTVTFVVEQQIPPTPGPTLVPGTPTPTIVVATPTPNP